MRELLSRLKDMDIAALLPDMSTFMGQLGFWLRLCLLLGPLVMAGLGAVYFFIPPNEANHALGYRCKWSMGSVEAWRYAQRTAGFLYMILGGGMAVVMVVVSIIISFMQPVGMAITVLVCLILEVAAVAVAHVLINKLLSKHYDSNGNPRKAG